jgi:hypothetical protein
MTWLRLAQGLAILGGGCEHRARPNWGLLSDKNFSQQLI